MAVHPEDLRKRMRLVDDCRGFVPFAARRVVDQTPHVDVERAPCLRELQVERKRSSRLLDRLRLAVAQDHLIPVADCNLGRKRAHRHAAGLGFLHGQLYTPAAHPDPRPRPPPPTLMYHRPLLAEELLGMAEAW